MILHCREIPQCIASYKRLPIDVAYITGYYEIELEEAIENFVKQTRYKNYLTLSDDVIANEQALKKVLHGLDSYDVVTGYCNIHKDTPYIVNTCTKRLWAARPLSGNDYPFISRTEADNNPEKYFRVYFVGACFTGMRHDYWLEYPVRPFPDGVGWGFDYIQSYALQENDVPMYAARGSFCQHLGGNLSLKPTLNGKVEKHIRLVEYNGEQEVWV
jgi:hypothetical protein